MSHKPVDIGKTKNDEDLPMAGLSIWHVLIFAIVVILLFGTAKLKNLGKDVGGAVKDFKKSIRDEEAEAAQLNEPRTLEHQNSNTTNSTVKH
jgi:sec-independent protein translocase protein TatA